MRGWGPALLAPLCALACAARWENVDRSSLPNAEAHPDAGWYVLHDEVAVVFGRDEKTDRPIADITTRIRMLILREAGRDVARLSVGYRAAFEEVVAVRARTISPSGEVKEYRRAEMTDRPSFANWVLYEDSRALVLEARPSTPGTIVEIEHTIRRRELHLLWVDQGFGNRVPSKLVRLSAIVPSSWQVDWSAHQLGQSLDWEPRRERLADGSEKLVWEKLDVPAYRDEPRGPSLHQRVPVIELRPRRWTEAKRTIEAFADERDLSKWLYELARPNLARTTMLSERAASAIENAGDPEAKARRLYSWVRDHVQYCAIEIGYGGWQPHAAGEVLQLRYGDCKDKANLLRGLLAEAGVPSRLAPVHHSSNGFRPRFALPTGHFNHMILIVDLPRGPVIVDPTSRTHAFGELPIGDQEAEILPIAPEGATRMVAPGSAAEDNLTQMEAELKVGADGDGAGNFHLLGRGHYAAMLRSDLLENTTKDRDKEVADWTDLKHAKVSELEPVRAQPTEEPSSVEVRGRVTALRVVGGEGARRVVRLGELVDGWLPRLHEHTRESPLLLRFRRHKRQRIRVVLPDGAQVSSLPEPAKLESPIGSYRVAWTVDQGAITVERELLLREVRVDPARYAEAKQFFDAVTDAEARPVVVKWR